MKPYEKTIVNKTKKIFELIKSKNVITHVHQTIKLKDFKLTLYSNADESYISFNVKDFLGVKQMEVSVFVKDGNFTTKTWDKTYMKFSVVTWLDKLLKTVKEKIDES
jgi:hypothetical protein